MPEDHRLSISSSQTLSPDEVARHTFGTVRRGFDVAEVRAYLDAVSHALAAAAEREMELRREVADAEHRAANPVLDETTLTTALGQETARVLQSAHDASNEMVAKAQAEARRLVIAAREEMAEAKTRAETVLAERTAEVEASLAEFRDRTHEESEALIAQTRAECQNMVDEAQSLRSRTLADLSRRRKVLHAQIEQLRAGREHLAETVRDVRRSVDNIADELFRAEDEARLAAEVAGREVVSRPPEGTPEEEAAILLADETVESGQTVLPEPAASPQPAASFEQTASSEPTVSFEQAVEPEPAASPKTAGPWEAEQSFSGDSDPDATVEVPETRETAQTPEIEGADGSAPSVDELFAKIRAASTDDSDDAGTADGASAEEQGGEGRVSEEPTGEEPKRSPEGEVESPENESDVAGQSAHPLVAARDELIAPMVKALSRRLKRTLQDDQNDLLDRLRHNGSVWSPELLAPDDEQLDSYATAILPQLEQAAHAGSLFVGHESEVNQVTDQVVGVAHDLATTIVGPLRRRLIEDERLATGDESVVAEQVGAAYREWKGERIERLAGDFAIAAFSTGSILGASDPVEWVAVATDGAVPCPDCDDNALNGPQQAGQAFPTGHLRPPVHSGCRCLLAPSAT